MEDGQSWPWDARRFRAGRVPLATSPAIADIMGADDTNEPGYLLGSVLIAGLALPQLAALARSVDPWSRDGEFVDGAYVMYIGVLFLSSYYWSHKTFVLRGFMWICEHFSNPPGKRMAFFYCALCTFVGTMMILAGFGVVRTRY